MMVIRFETVEGDSKAKSAAETLRRVADEIESGESYGPIYAADGEVLGFYRLNGSPNYRVLAPELVEVIDRLVDLAKHAEPLRGR